MAVPALLRSACPALLAIPVLGMLVWITRLTASAPVDAPQAGGRKEVSESGDANFRVSARESQLSPQASTPEPASSVKKGDSGAKLAALQAARDAALEIEDLDERQDALADLCYQWAGVDPRGSVELAISCGVDVPGLYQNLAHQWAEADLPGARAWVELQESGKFRSDLAARIAFTLSSSDPAAAAKYVSNMDPGPEQIEAAISVVHQWAAQDRKAATAWAENFPAGEMRERALHEINPRPLVPSASE